MSATKYFWRPQSKRLIVSFKSMWQASCGACCPLHLVIIVMKACYYWSHKLNLLTSFHTPGPHVVTMASVPCPGDHTHRLPCSSSALVTRLLLSRDSGDFWSPQRALSLTQVWSSSWSPTLTANITLMDPCFLIIRCTVHFLEPFLLYFSFYQTWGSYWQYCGTCKLWAGPGPLTVSSCDGEKLRSRDCWDPEWGVSADQKMSWSCEWVFRILTPPPLWWPLTMGAVSHSRPLLCDILILIRHSDFANSWDIYFVFLHKDKDIQFLISYKLEKIRRLREYFLKILTTRYYLISIWKINRLLTNDPIYVVQQIHTIQGWSNILSDLWFRAGGETRHL